MVLREHMSGTTMSNDWLVSYPRSGNTWLRYIIEWHLLRPTIGYWQPGQLIEGQKQLSKHHIDSPIYNKVNCPNVISYIGNNKPVLKRHSVSEIEPQQSDVLVLLLRNYKECIMRHLMTIDEGLAIIRAYDPESKQTSRYFNETCYEEVEKYMDNVQRYEDWPGPKMIVYYEELILNPSKEIIKVLEFLNHECAQDTIISRHKDFMRDYEGHKQASLQIYAHNGDEPITNGQPSSLRHYSATLQSSEWGKEIPLKLDIKAAECNQELWVRYLKQYREMKK